MKKKMEFRRFKFEIREINESEGKMEGFASIYNQLVPSYNEYVSPGAFTRTLQEHKAFRFMYNHEDWIGELTAEDRKKGLYVRAECVMDVQRSREAFSLAKLAKQYENPAGFSIGFNTVVDHRDKMNARWLDEIALWETSLCPFQAAPNAIVTDIRRLRSSIMNKRMEKRIWDETENEIAYRMRDPEEFDQDSFRRVPIQEEEPRVFAIMGKLMGEDTMTIQALRFPKDDGWDMESAKAWVDEHPDVEQPTSVDDQRWYMIPEFDKAHHHNGTAIIPMQPRDLHRIGEALDGFNNALRN